MKGGIQMEKRYRSLEELPMVLTVEDLMPILSIGRNTAYELIRSGQRPSRQPINPTRGER